MKTERLDHTVLRVTDIETTALLYQTVMEMKSVTFAGGRQPVTFGDQKINLYQQGNKFGPRADSMMPASADLCFIVDPPVLEVREQLDKWDSDILDAPARRTGACGDIVSVYIRDPDANLIAKSNYL